MNPWGVSVPPPTEAAFFNAARATTFLLVEGASDERFWLSYIDSRACQVRAAGGRDKALEQLATTRTESIPGFVAVLDADFYRAEGTLEDDPDVVWTDLHDLETLLVASPALEKVLIGLTSARKQRDFERAERCTIRDALLARAVEIGKLRWLSRRDDLRLVFRKAASQEAFTFLDYSKFCDRTTWKLDPAKLVKTVLDFSSRPDLKVQDLLRSMESLPSADPWQLCVGHDLTGLLMVGVRSKLGTKNFPIEDLQERLRLAFERAHLEQTAMFTSLRAWETRNAPRRVFTR